MDHVEGTEFVPEPNVAVKVAVEDGVGELVQPVLVRLGHEGGNKFVSERGYQVIRNHGGYLKIISFDTFVRWRKKNRMKKE